MKKFFTIALLLFSFAAFGQNARTEEYASLRVALAPFSGGKYIFILEDGVDRGFKSAFYEGTDKKAMSFKSLAEILNFVNGFGWEPFTYEKSRDTNGEYQYLMLRRKITK